MTDALTQADWDARLNRPEPCDSHGLTTDGGYKREAWTPRAFLIRGDRLLLKCRTCGHEAEAPAQRLVDAGKGDIPWGAYSGRWKCEARETPDAPVCGSLDIEVSLDLARERNPRAGGTPSRSPPAPRDGPRGGRARRR